MTIGKHMLEQENKKLEATLNRFFQGLQAGLKSLKEVREIYNERVAFEFNSVNFFYPNENKISEILAFFLDPDETHGQKDKFLRVFIEKFDIKNALEILELKKSVKVVTEKLTNENRRIDIFINLSGFMIGVENKIWDAVDQKDQVQHYVNFLDKQSNGNYVLFFLPSHGYDPSERSITKESFESLKEAGKLQVISFKKDIIELFEKFEAVCKADNVRAFIKDFQQYLKQKFLGETIMNEGDFIKDYIRKNKNIISYTDTINEKINQLMNEFKAEISSTLKKMLIEDALEIEIEDYWTGYDQIKYKNSCLEKYGFTIAREKFEIGIPIRDEVLNENLILKNKVKSFFEEMKTQCYPKYTENDYWKGGYVALPSRAINNKVLSKALNNPAEIEFIAKQHANFIIEYIKNVEYVWQKVATNIL